MPRVGGYLPEWTEPKQHSTTRSKAELLRRCGVSPKTGDNWPSSCEGLRQDKAGRYHTRWLCAWLKTRQETRRRTPLPASGSVNWDAELARARIAHLRGQTQMTRAKLGKLLEGLVTSESVTAAIDSIGQLVSSNLSRLPKRLSQRLEGGGLKRDAIQGVVQEEIEQITGALRRALSELELTRPRASSVWLELGGVDPDLEEGEED